MRKCYKTCTFHTYYTSQYFTEITTIKQRFNIYADCNTHIFSPRRRAHYAFC